MKVKNLSPAQFADRIGIQRSGLSHILAGRNNPSLDFVLKVLAAFPEISPSWLLQGKGEMYVNLAVRQDGQSFAAGTSPVGSLTDYERKREDAFPDKQDAPPFIPAEKNFSENPDVHSRKEEISGETDSVVAESFGPDIAEEGFSGKSEAEIPRDSSGGSSFPVSDASPFSAWETSTCGTDKSRLIRIVLFYADGTYEVCTPRGGEKQDTRV